MKRKVYVLVSEKKIIINDKENREFLCNIEKSILLSLKERNLLTLSQYNDCINKVETVKRNNSKGSFKD